jgi:CDP-alcohol phosphatidyltransferase
VLLTAGQQEEEAGMEQRDKRFLLARPEARVLEWIAKRIPSAVKPDHLTALGVVASIGIAAAYVLSNGDKLWLWAASALLVVHWLGDSLDGTLARVRRSERPRYGYYLDHLVDAFATAAIGIGLGLSPYMLLAVGLAIVVAYLILSINTYLETHAFGVFTLGYGRFGPHRGAPDADRGQHADRARPHRHRAARRARHRPRGSHDRRTDRPRRPQPEAARRAGAGGLAGA